jgi:dTDP-4-dehydrorhamnose 3,5-epimerase
MVVATDGAAMITVHELALPGLLLLESPVHGDERGFFREWFWSSELADAGVNFTSCQANLSRSRRNSVRGLHYSLAPEGQAKLVTCADGALDDVVVDVRVGSPTFGQYEYVSLLAEEGKSLYVPEGLAHGFCVTSASATIAYLLSSPYDVATECGFDPFDEAVGVPWPVVGEPILSARDTGAPSLADRQRSGELPIF